MSLKDFALRKKNQIEEMAKAAGSGSAGGALVSPGSATSALEGPAVGVVLGSGLSWGVLEWEWERESG